MDNEPAPVGDAPSDSMNGDSNHTMQLAVGAIVLILIVAGAYWWLTSGSHRAISTISTTVVQQTSVTTVPTTTTIAQAVNPEPSFGNLSVLNASFFPGMVSPSNVLFGLPTYPKLYRWINNNTYVTGGNYSFEGHEMYGINGTAPFTSFEAPNASVNITVPSQYKHVTSPLAVVVFILWIRTASITDSEYTQYNLNLYEAPGHYWYGPNATVNAFNGQNSTVTNSSVGNEYVEINYTAFGGLWGHDLIFRYKDYMVAVTTLGNPGFNDTYTLGIAKNYFSMLRQGAG